MNSIDQIAAPAPEPSAEGKPGSSILKQLLLNLGAEPAATRINLESPAQSPQISAPQSTSAIPTSKPHLKKDGFEVPAAVLKEYNMKDGKYFDRDGNLERFRDHGKKLTTDSDDRKVVADMIELVQAKNWTAVKFKGSESFRRTAWLEAESRGISTKGYTPNAYDLAQLELKKSAREKLDGHSAHKNEIVHDQVRQKQVDDSVPSKAKVDLSVDASTLAAFKVLNDALRGQPKEVQRAVMDKAMRAVNNKEVDLPAPLVAERGRGRAEVERERSREVTR